MPVCHKDMLGVLPISMASDIYAPVLDSETQQAENGGVSLMATSVNDVPHILIFSSQENMKGFVETGTRFAKVAGHDLFPLLLGNHAILNPGPSGLKLSPEDIAEINGQSTPLRQESCGAPGHVHGPDCQH